ncbi:type I-B CRISPR-associated endonuclease Cas1b [Lachnobacterium bovis]|uniref:CRISPR-associated endonuclease Cas1 n=1 Tax=Lachnobacterium bovis TaxID=140626 RepID=A0A1H9S5S6_9FIRM|nr:type I-B CRISPR-associated endonuclease Cas1b [Lachnobacterium bovis]SER80347.1 CRISP-associated protein Cas1 [Lachnobacterium bovis]
MKRSFYLYSEGQLERHDNTIRFIYNENDRKDIPIEQVSEIYVMNQMNFNMPFLNLLSQNNVIMHLFNYYDYYIGSFYPRESLLSGKAIVKQVETYTDKEKRLNLAKALLEASSYNIYRNLRYYNGRGKELDFAMKRILELRNQIIKCRSIQELMGIEGNIRKCYYEQWEAIINNKFPFKQRIMHPPDNEVNSLISYVNSLIYTKTLSQIYKTQLNPTISFLHEPGERRFSLCLDLSEIFKPLIGDRLIFSLINKGQITDKSFDKGLNGLHLTKRASQTILQSLDERMKKTIFHKELNKNVSYEYLIRLEAYKLVKHIFGEKEYKGFEMWW